MERNFGLHKTTKQSIPSIPFERLARAVLGARYELSLVVCGDALARRMNKAYRKKSYTPNVLSFPITKYAGEIFLNIRSAEREAELYHTSLRARLPPFYIPRPFPF